jgi:hypothetical protein
MFRYILYYANFVIMDECQRGQLGEHRLLWLLQGDLLYCDYRPAASVDVNFRFKQYLIELWSEVSI